LLLNKFPGDIARFRLALTLIIAHQRLRDAPVPVNDDLSAFHRQLRRTADHVISAGSDDKRRRYFGCWKSWMLSGKTAGLGGVAAGDRTGPAAGEMLHKYQHVLTSSNLNRRGSVGFFIAILNRRYSGKQREPRVGLS
jgi:p-hydroxybenzoic acid efflux pump subunit AaeB